MSNDESSMAKPAWSVVGSVRRSQPLPSGSTPVLAVRFADPPMTQPGAAAVFIGSLMIAAAALPATVSTSKTTVKNRAKSFLLVS